MSCCSFHFVCVLCVYRRPCCLTPAAMCTIPVHRIAFPCPSPPTHIAHYSPCLSSSACTLIMGTFSARPSILSMHLRPCTAAPMPACACPSPSAAARVCFHCRARVRCGLACLGKCKSRVCGVACWKREAAAACAVAHAVLIVPAHLPTTAHGVPYPCQRLNGPRPSTALRQSHVLLPVEV